MTKIDQIKKAWKFLEHATKKNLPTLMSIGAGIGVGITAGLIIKETPAAMERIKEREEKDPDITTFEKTATAMIEYRAAIIAFLITEGLIFGSNYLSLKRITSWAAICSVLSKDNKTKERLNKALVEMLGEEKVEEIKKTFEKTDPELTESFRQNAYTVEKATKYGKNEKRPCVVGLTGAKFYASYNQLEAGIMKSKDSFAPIGDAYYISLGDVLYNMGAPDCDAGDMLGFLEDFDATVVECVVDGAAGWKVIFLSAPIMDFDQSK